MWSWLLGNNNGNSSSSAARAARLGSFLQTRREFTLANMQHLHHQLLRYSELPDAEIVEILRVLSEFLIYSDQNRAVDHGGGSGGGGTMGSPPAAVEFAAAASTAGVFFDYFCEKNILALLLQLGQSAPRVAVQIQLLQTLSILVQNIATRTSLYYLLSNNYVNKLLECPFAYDHDDDVRDWFVTLLKALSLRLNEDTVQFFFDAERDAFPLYAQALRFGRCSETMVKVAVKTLMLNVLKVQDDRVRRFLLTYQKMAYFADVVEYANELALKIQGLLNIWTPTAAAVNDKLDEAVDAYIDHCYYLQDILDVNLPELCYKVGDLLFTRHVKHLLAVSVLPNCNPPPQRISTRLALYLLTRLLGILEHTPLVNAISFLLLSPDAHERSEYSTVALGAGGSSAPRRKSTRGTSTSAMSTTEATATGSSSSSATTGGSSSSVPATKSGTRKSKSGVRKPSRRRIVFRAHATGECNSPVCYLQTRYSHGEWPLDEVRAFELQETNWFRQSLLALTESSDEVLAATALLVVLAVVNNASADHSLLREMDLLPYRHRKHHHHHQGSNAFAMNDSVPEANENARESSASSLSSVASSQGETEESPSDGTTEIVAGDTASRADALQPMKSPQSPSHSMWLVDRVLRLLNRAADVRLLSTQLCARLLLDLVCDNAQPLVGAFSVDSAATTRDDISHQRLSTDQLHALVAVHSVCTHQVMQSMRGAMADVDLFVYVLEDEFTDFQKAPFPLVLQLKTSSPYEYLVPLAPSADAQGATEIERKTTLHLRHPVNEMEACRKAMRAFLILRRLRAMVDPGYVDDGLDELTAWRHPHTAMLAAIAPSRHTTNVRDTVALSGMVFLKCVWREQRFFATPARLLMVLNPEALVLVERYAVGDKGGDAEDERGFVRLFALVHRVHASLDAKDDLVLHLTISSAVTVEGCRSHRKAPPKDNAGRGALRNWHVSVLFESAEDARQAKANVDLCRAEVRAFKLLTIEEALSTHVQITSSHGATTRDSVASSVLDELDLEEKEKEHENEKENETDARDD